MKICVNCGYTAPDESRQIDCPYCEGPTATNNVLAKPRMYTERQAEEFVRQLMAEKYEAQAEKILRWLGYTDTGQARSITWQKPTKEGVKVFYL